MTSRSTILVVILAICLGTSCKKMHTVIVDVSLIENPGEKQPRYVPKGYLKRGEHVKILNEKLVNGAKFLQVQIEGVDTKGWIEEKWLKEGKLQSVTVVRDADIFTRPNDKSPKLGIRARAGQVAFQLSTSGEFSQVQYPGVEGYVMKSHLGDGSMVVRTVSIPGLGVANVSATSQYKRTEGTEAEFDPRNLFDGSLQTAWCEGKSGDDAGVGESISLNFENPVTIEKVEIVNGWTRSEELYNMNSRVSSMRVTAAGGGSSTVSLQDKEFDYQSAELNLSGFSFQFTIDGIHKGRDPDTCVAEIRIIGRPGPAANN